MKQIRILLTIGCLVSLSAPALYSQNLADYSFGEGLGLVAADSSFALTFSARIQSLYEGEFTTGDHQYSDGFQIRRSRLKFDGFAYSPKLQYKIELAVANSDIASGGIPQSGNTANIVLDAVVKWNFSGRWSLWFGQTKLPGNRERMISSQNLQLVDRSNVNSRFTLDRDGGLQLHYKGKKVNLMSAFSMGEGRNIIVANAGGHNYTLRGEYLPFGAFTEKGDYFMSDLMREPEPKLSLALSYNYNDDASRQRGHLGDFMTEARDLSTWFADAHFKYRGFSSLVEFAHRRSPDGPVLFDVDGNYADAFYTGHGLSAQAGYLFKNNLEIAGRYTVVNPEDITLRPRNTQYTLGLSKYLVGHSLKVQTDVTLISEERTSDVIMYRLQVEVAF